MRKKVPLLSVITLAMTSLLMLGLTGCGHQHVWEDATCSAPRTCSECGETEGDALGHSWEDATCSTPRACSVCGETEGDALGHSWEDATYDAPRTCSVCRETEGSALTPSFEEHGLTINVKEDTVYDYVSVCYLDPSKETVGHLIISDYQIVKDYSDLDLEVRKGYEWRTFRTTISFDDDNANNYGPRVRLQVVNYYDIEGWEDSYNYDNAINGQYFTANYHGTDYECCCIIRDQSPGWIDDTYTNIFDFYISVPIGYDGVVLAFFNKQPSQEEDTYIYNLANEETLFFRLD